MNLSVNLNKVALLRNSRGGANPGLLVAGTSSLNNGAAGLTLHWRADNRHARAADVRVLSALCRELKAEFNLEGDDRGELIDLAVELGVTQFTLVPVRPGEVTSDHGWDLPRQNKIIVPIVSRLKSHGIRTAIFVDAVPEAMVHAAATGADRIEIYTEPYAAAFGTPRFAAELARVRETARAAVLQGLSVNAGHDLNLLNTPVLAREVAEISEVSIGHALIADALYLGVAETVRRYVQACRGQDVVAPETH